MKKQELEHELGRYKKAVETRDIVIGKLKEELAGMQEVINILSSYIVYLLPEGEEVHIKKDDILNILSNDVSILETNMTDDEYILKRLTHNKEDDTVNEKE